MKKKSLIEVYIKAYYRTLFADILRIQYLNKISESSILIKATTQASIDIIQNIMDADMRYLKYLNQKGMF